VASLLAPPPLLCAPLRSAKVLDPRAWSFRVALLFLLFAFARHDPSPPSGGFDLSPPPRCFVPLCGFRTFETAGRMHLLFVSYLLWLAYFSRLPALGVKYEPSYSFPDCLSLKISFPFFSFPLVLSWQICAVPSRQISALFSTRVSPAESTPGCPLLLLPAWAFQVASLVSYFLLFGDTPRFEPTSPYLPRELKVLSAVAGGDLGCRGS